MMLSVALVGSLAAGIAVAWVPGYWGLGIVQGCLLAIAVVWLFAARSWYFPVVSVFPVLIGVWGWLQMVCSGSVANYVTRRDALQWSFAALGFLLASQVLRGSAARSLFLTSMVWVCAAFSLLGVLQLYSAPGTVLWYWPMEGAYFGTFSYKNQFGAMLELAVPAALYVMLFKTDRFWTGLSVFLALFAGAVACSSRAAAGLVTAETVLLLLLAWRAGKIRLSALLIALPGLALLLAGVAYISVNEVAVTHYQDVHLDAIRKELMKATVAMIGKAPWSGYGLGTWSFVYPQYALFDNGRWANIAHNDWLEWMAEGGVVYAGSFAGMLVLSARKVLRHPWSLGVLSLGLHSWVDYPTRDSVIGIFWFVMAGALAAASLRSKRDASEPPAEA